MGSSERLQLYKENIKKLDIVMEEVANEDIITPMPKNELGLVK